jgi:hypothetical protein
MQAELRDFLRDRFSAMANHMRNLAQRESQE